MLIRTCENEYTVLRQTESDDLREVFICKNYARNDNNEYSVVRIKDISLMKRLTLIFTDTALTEPFTDFIECFNDMDSLCLVFAFRRSRKFLETISGKHCSLPERMEVGAKLLEKMVLQNMPLFVQTGALDLNNIFVTESLDVEFSYTLNRLTDFDKTTDRDVYKLLAEIFKLIFKKEIEREILADIDIFLKKLDAGKFKSYIEVYDEYAKLTNKIRSLTDEEIGLKNGFLFRAWNGLKTIFSALKKVIIALLIIAAVYYTVTSITDLYKERAVPVNSFQQIGDVDIH